MKRFRIPPGDITDREAADRMGIAPADFAAVLPNLIERGFPKPDPDTGNFDLDAIDAWRKLRHPHLFNSPDYSMGARDASTVAQDRIAAASRGGNR